MSTKLADLDGVEVTRFWGGDRNGVSIQLSCPTGFVNLNFIEIEQLIEIFKRDIIDYVKEV